MLWCDLQLIFWSKRNIILDLLLFCEYLWLTKTKITGCFFSLILTKCAFAIIETCMWRLNVVSWLGENELVPLTFQLFINCQETYIFWQRSRSAFTCGYRSVFKWTPTQKQLSHGHMITFGRYKLYPFKTFLVF